MNSNWIRYILAIAFIAIILAVTYKQIHEYHLQEDPMLHTLKNVLKDIHPIIPKIKLYKGEKSFTINKERIFLCLKDENGEYYPLNMLIYVLLHEISHMLNDKDVGHTPAFHMKFEEMLDKATKMGVYNPSIPVIQGYCEYNK